MSDTVQVLNDHEHCIDKGKCWQRSYPCPALEPEDEPQRDEDGKIILDLATCGHCGRSWNDAISTQWTPAPSGRCPFEYDHEYDEDEDDGL